LESFHFIFLSCLHIHVIYVNDYCFALQTKDKTKDFIRRWKTLPENHPDFDHLVTEANQQQQRQLGSSSFNSSNPQGSSTLDGTPTQAPNPFGKMKHLAKKFSESEIPPGSENHHQHHEDPGGGAGIAGSVVPKSSTGWSVHVWGKSKS
jgi:hypothetical protein